MARSALLLGAVAVTAAALVGCTTSSTPSDEGSAEPDDAGAASTIIDEDFPDPDVLTVDGRHFLFATNDSTRNVPFAESDDLEEWTVSEEDALPDLPSWVIPGKTWAPEVTQFSEDRFVMYFTATNFSPARQCIGVATASSPEGPYEVAGSGMLVCPDAEGGAIDASTFASSDGTRFLLWKNDGNCCGLDTWLQMAPLTPDGLALAGPAQRLVKQDLPWEGDLVEAPTLIERDGTFHLLYSANSYGDERYAIGHASSPSLDGPWTKDPEPLLATDDLAGAGVGPGGQDVVSLDDGDMLVFHAWDENLLERRVHRLPLEWDEGRPRVVL